ncbi:NCS2 family permease [Peptoniphilus equinus]|uniref:NCS2 family permease n=1 Tax=Peptoniphilus equinus TaxID=3016343 RepID=A0ABY7QT20_9FIRM|nr:NCS2 family permease [Peptoniphilus equinus]WBW49616.1 NCS2 family permease [Peptoniphilus equinus]
MDKKQQGFLERYFQLSKFNTTVKTEILAGITTFITVAYILIIIPQTVSDPLRIMEQGDMAQKVANGVFIATCIGAFIGTLLVALYAKLPFAQAPGMGLSAFFAYTVMLGMGYTYQQALVIVLLSGAVFIAITGIGLREAIIRAIPACIKDAMTPGIGLFITIIGLKSASIVVANSATLVSMVDFSQWQNPDFDVSLIMSAVVALSGLVIIGALNAKKVKGSILIGIIIATLIGIPLGVTRFDAFDLNLATKFQDFYEVSLLNLDFAGLFAGDNFAHNLFTVVMLVISFSLVNMFDSLGTLLGAAKQGNMVDKNGEIINMKQALMSDAISTLTGAMVGTPTVTTLVESSAGIAEGGRTGLTALTTALLFVAAIVFAPFVSIIPAAATAPALIYVGVLMLSNVKDVDFSDITEAIPAFITITFMPFTYSIANGIAMGLISYCLLKLFTGKLRDIKLLTAVVSIIFALRYILISLG